jgi:hypothetical protein
LQHLKKAVNKNRSGQRYKPNQRLVRSLDVPPEW